MKNIEVLDVIKNGNIFDITPDFFANRFMIKDEMEAIFKKFGAFWEYSGVPCAEKPHAILKSGKHSNGFIACKDVLKYPSMCELFAHEIFKYLKYEDISRIDTVASSAYSAINIGYEVARLIGRHVEHVIVEKDSSGNPTIIRGGIGSMRTVLVINELMTTGNGSTWETKQAVLKCNGDNPAPIIFEKSLVLVHRSRDFFLKDNSVVIPTFHFDIEDFEAENCPYCKAGSQPIKPKVGNNWSIINGLK